MQSGSQLKGKILCLGRVGLISISLLLLFFNKQISQVPPSFISDCLDQGILDWKAVEAVKYVKQYMKGRFFFSIL